MLDQTTLANLVWLIPLLPLLACGFFIGWGKKLHAKVGDKLAWLSVLAIAIPCVIAVGILVLAFGMAVTPLVTSGLGLARSARKDAAVQFLQLVVAGRIDEGYARHVDLAGRHHNPYFAAGFPALKKAMIEDEALNPRKKLIVQHALVDGDLVAVHSHLVVSPEGPGLTVVHLFRFEGEKIAEMWDIAAALPADSPNADGAF